jgi:hypothetical protein
MAGKYLIVYNNFSVVPSSLRAFVKKKIEDELSQFDLDLDFSERGGHDYTVTFSNDIPGLNANADSSRPDNNGSLFSGSTTVYVGGMKARRLQVTTDSCDVAFPETEAALGSMIANTTIHENGHMLGLDSGGIDGAGHTKDPNNYMWSAESMSPADTLASPLFIYTITSTDTLSRLVDRYNRGLLDKCHIGSSDLSWQDVWQLKENKAFGFIAHPTKSGIRNRIPNDPNWIYPGEKVALLNINLRTADYRRKLAGFMGRKTFTDDQIATMKKFIAQQLAAGKG